MLHKIRLIVIIFAVFFIIRSPADSDLSFSLFYHVPILCSMQSESGVIQDVVLKGR